MQVLHRFVNHGSLFALSMILRRIVGFLLLPLYTRYLGPAEYGIIEMLVVMISITETLFGLRLGQAMSKYYFEIDTDKWRSQVIYTTILSAAPLNIFIISIIFFTSDELSNLLLGTADYSSLVVLFSILIPIHLLESHGEDYCRITARAKNVLIFSVIKLFLQVTLNIYLLVFLDMGVTGIAYASIIASSINAFLYQSLIYKNTKIDYSIELLITMVKFSLPLWGAAGIGVVAGSLDRYAIRTLIDLNTLGQYALAAKFASLMGLVWQPIAMVWQPMRFELYHEIEDNSSLISLYSRVFRYLCFALSLVALTISLFSQDVIYFMAAEQFRGSEIVIAPLTFAAYLSFITIFASFSLLLKEKTKYMMYGQAIAAITIFISLIILIPAFGVYGAAIAVLLGQCTRLLWIAILSKHYYDMNLPWMTFAFLISTTFIISNAPLIINFGTLERIIVKCLILGVTSILLWYIIFNEQERNLALNTVISRLKKPERHQQT